jgi:type IV secretion system protein VirB10
MSNQPNVDQTVDVLPGEERGMPSVNDTRPSTAKRGLIVIVLLLIVAAAVGIGYWKYQRNAAKASAATVQKDLQLTNSVPERTFQESPVVGVAPALPGGTPVVPALEVDGIAAVPVAGAPALPGSASAPGAANARPAPALDKSGSSLMAVSAKTTADDDSSEGTPPAAAGGDGGTGGGMGEMLTSTRTGARKAGMLGNRNFLLAKGSFIDCSLQTRLDSTVPGMTACVITRSIYSDNGKVLLIERGSTVTGEYKANMRQGMARIFVLWSRIKTPNGIVIPLDSPGTDQLGGAGVPGYVDNHFWQRFGGALMLSLVDDVANGLTQNSGSGSGGQFNFNSTGNATSDMAAEALKNTINIPPTLYKNQGEQVGIYVARDLDFSSVYDVAAK